MKYPVAKCIVILSLKFMLVANRVDMFDLYILALGTKLNHSLLLLNSYKIVIVSLVATIRHCLSSATKLNALVTILQWLPDFVNN